jgi:hypothetical protein
VDLRADVALRSCELTQRVAPQRSRSSSTTPSPCCGIFLAPLPAWCFPDPDEFRRTRVRVSTARSGETIGTPVSTAVITGGTISSGAPEVKPSTASEEECGGQWKGVVGMGGMESDRLVVLVLAAPAVARRSLSPARGTASRQMAVSMGVATDEGGVLEADSTEKTRMRQTAPSNHFFIVSDMWIPLLCVELAF